MNEQVSLNLAYTNNTGCLLIIFHMPYPRIYVDISLKFSTEQSKS